jgi:secretion/DNA translocation related CpaE-like protein
VGVLGGSGGAGASLLAAALATAACDAGEDVLLLDADPHSGGADLLLGAEALPGLRWGDLAGLAGRVRPDVLRACVDAGLHRGTGGSLRVLAGDRSGADAAVLETVPAVLAAARRTFGLTVLDLPRGALAALPDEVLSGCEEVLVVLPATSRAAAAACTVVDAVRRRPDPPPVRIVLREVGTHTVPADLADAVGAPLAGVLRSERELDAGLERGEGLPGGRRSGLRGLAARWVADTGPTGRPA